MDGGGSIQVNHWRRECLQYRLVIKLKETPANAGMLNTIAVNIGGAARSCGGFVVWVENSQKRILRLLQILDRYPPLTTRLRLQLAFLRRMLQASSKGLSGRAATASYLSVRADKYLDRAALQRRVAEEILAVPYFCE